MKNNKLISTIIIFIIYGVGIVLSTFAYPFLDGVLSNNNNPLLILLLIDVLFTVYIFIFSIILKNSSVYDPYWSVVPVWIILLYIQKVSSLNLYNLIILLVFLVWSIRLTLNWLINFKNLNNQDWRYQMLKEKHPKLWFVINLFGIHLMPTLVVFLAMIPGLKYIDLINGKDLPTISTWLGVAVALIGVVISFVADGQMLKFRKNKENKNKIMNKGLWKKSRHPNYFGEILFWFGIAMMGISFAKTQNWILITSPIVILLLFSFISVPMMEKHMIEKNEAYKEYAKNTNMFSIIF